MKSGSRRGWRPLARDEVLRVALRYPDASALFERPAISPFDADYADYSATAGIEFLTKELAANPSLRSVETTLLLPPEQITPHLEQRTRTAIQRYCLARLRTLGQERRALRWRSSRSLVLACLVVLVSVWLAQHFANSTSFVLQVLSTALAFGSWVVIWFPLDSLVFGMWQFHLDAEVYRRLRAMALTIKPETGGADGP